jgi:hypothetical protein
MWVIGKMGFRCKCRKMAEKRQFSDHLTNKAVTVILMTQE